MRSTFKLAAALVAVTLASAAPLAPLAAPLARRGKGGKGGGSHKGAAFCAKVGGTCTCTGYSGFGDNAGTVVWKQTSGSFTCNAAAYATAGKASPTGNVYCSCYGGGGKGGGKKPPPPPPPKGKASKTGGGLHKGGSACASQGGTCKCVGYVSFGNDAFGVL